MTVTEILVIASGLAIGYWFVSVFLPHMRKDTTEADRWAARERPEGPWLQDRPDIAPGAAAPPPIASEHASPAWHEVLGVSASASHEEILAAYHARLDDYKPERVAALGPEIRALAARKTEQIHEAYQAATGRH